MILLNDKMILQFGEISIKTPSKFIILIVEYKDFWIKMWWTGIKDAFRLIINITLLLLS